MKPIYETSDRVLVRRVPRCVFAAEGDPVPPVSLVGALGVGGQAAQDVARDALVVDA